VKLSAAVMLGLLATSRGCPSEVKPLDPDDDRDRHCQGMAGGWGTCAPGIAPIDPPRRALGFNKPYFQQTPEGAFVDSISGEAMVLEGPWDMPYTFTWFESLEGAFALGEDVQLSGSWGWSVVTSAGAIFAHYEEGACSRPPPSRPTEDGPEVDFVAACTTDGDRIVYGISATLGDESVVIGQGERGRIGDWEILFHGAVSASGYVENCEVSEGYFHGAVSAWKRP